MSEKNKVLGITQIAKIGVMTAVICVLAPFSIPLPFSPVPISLTMLAIYFSAYALGMWGAGIAYVVYLLLGLVGVPVFSGFTAGPGKLFGPTGGYLIAFLATALVTGFFVDKFENIFLHGLGMIVGITIAYVVGSIWLSVQAGMSLSAAFMAGTVPFIPADLIKIVIAAIVGPQLRKTLIRANLYQNIVIIDKYYNIHLSDKDK